MTDPSRSLWDIVALLRAHELAAHGRPVPAGVPQPRKLPKVARKGWLLLPRAARLLRTDLASLEAAARSTPALELGMAEPPRLFGIFRRRPERAVRWAAADALQAAFKADPAKAAAAVTAHPALAARLVAMATASRGSLMPGEVRPLPEPQRILSPARSRESLLQQVDPNLTDVYAREDLAQGRRRRPPSSPLKFSDGYPARDLSSAMRLLVTARASEVADRLRSGLLAQWFREEAGEDEMAAVIDAVVHVVQERGEGDEAARARLLQYLRRTAVGADLERDLVEPMAESLRSRDSARVAASAQALLLLDSDLAAAELASALFETDPACRAPVVAALGETGSPRAVDALERLAKASTRAEDREAAAASLKRLAEEGVAMEIARAAIERLRKAQ
jgi:hypothetical protein